MGGCEGKDLGGSVDAAQRVCAARLPVARQRLREWRRGDQRIAERLRQSLEPRHLVHGGTFERELKAVGNTDIAVDYLAPMEADAESERLAGWWFPAPPAACPGSAQKNSELLAAVIPEHARGKPIELWWQSLPSGSDPRDEARVGQQGSLTYVWAEKGSRPRAPRDQRYEWAYLFGAVCPARGIGAALVLPEISTEAMNLHLAEISRWVAPGAHAVVNLDGAGWHQVGGRLQIPDNISLLPLPPYSPELNPVENIWQFLRQNYLANSVYAAYEAIVDACCQAWNALAAAPDTIRSIASRAWAETVIP